MQGVMRLVGGTGAEITREAIRAGNWKRVEEEFTPLDLINVDQCFNLTPERRKWVNELLEKKRIERSMCLKCGEVECTCDKEEQ